MIIGDNSMLSITVSLLSPSYYLVCMFNTQNIIDGQQSEDRRISCSEQKEKAAKNASQWTKVENGIKTVKRNWSSRGRN